MADPAASSVLRRKTAFSQTPLEAAVLTPPRALRRALIKAAEKGLRLAVTVTEFRETQMTLNQITEAAPESGLLVLLSDPEGALGMMTLDLQVLSGVIEVQTNGRVIAAQARARNSTRTDAAMCEGFLNQVMERLESELRPAGLGPWFYGFRFGARVETSRKLGLALEDVPYRSYQVTLDLGQGAKTGVLTLAVPATPRQDSLVQVSARERLDWRDRLQQTVLGSPAQIEAVLHRMKMPLSQAGGLQVGDMIPFPAERMREVELVDRCGVKHGRAKLGQSLGRRAVMLLENTSPAGMRRVRQTTTHSASASASEPAEAAVAGGSGQAMDITPASEAADAPANGVEATPPQEVSTQMQGLPDAAGLQGGETP